MVRSDEFTVEELRELISGLSWKDSEGQGEELTEILGKELIMGLDRREKVEKWELRRWGIYD